MVDLKASVTTQEINAIRVMTNDDRADLAARINATDPFSIFDSVEGKEGKEIICPFCGSGTHDNKNTGIVTTFKNGVWLYHCFAGNDCEGVLTNIIADANNLSTKGKDWFTVLAIGAKIIGGNIFSSADEDSNSQKNVTEQKSMTQKPNQKKQPAAEYERLAEAQSNLEKFVQNQGGFWRGLPFEVLQRLKWGYLPDIYFSDAKKKLPAVIIPNDLNGIFARAVEAKNYRNNTPTATTTIFLPPTDEFDLIVVEGAINGASILTVIATPNFGIVASGGTSGNKNVVARVHQLVAEGKKIRVMVAYDNDKSGAGQKASADLLQMLKKENIVAVPIDITKIADVDLNDVLRNDGREKLAEMVNSAVHAAQIELEKVAAEMQAAFADETCANNDSDSLQAQLQEIENQLDTFEVKKDEAINSLLTVETFDRSTVFSEEFLNSVAFAKIFSPELFSVIKTNIQNFKRNNAAAGVSLIDFQSAVKHKIQEVQTQYDTLIFEKNKILARIDYKKYVAKNDILKNLVLPDNYSMNDSGIYKTTKKGAIQICRRPIIIKAKFYGVDSKIYKLILMYKSENKWRELPPFERLTIFNAKNLIELTNYGLPVTSANAFNLVDFLDAFFIANEEKLPLTYTASKFGWQELNGEEFFLDPRRNSTVEVEGKNYSFMTDSDNRFSKALTTKGSIDEWRRVYDLAKDSPVARFMVAASVAAPLLKVLGERNFLLHTFATTRAGKTTALNLGLSAIGSENLMVTFDATKNGLLGTAAAANDYLLAVDEKQAADQNILKQIMNFVYSFGGGTGRAKLKKDSSLRDIEQWRGICITTGETELLDDNATGGAHTRLLQIAAPAEILPADICADIRQTVKKNYGHVLPLVIDKIFEIGNEKLREIFSDVVKKFDNYFSNEQTKNIYLTEHQRYVAVITVADCILNLALGVDKETAYTKALYNALLVFDFIPKSKDISDAEKEKDFVIGFIAEKSAHFESSEVYNKDRGLDCYGRSNDEEEFTFLTVSALQILCKDKALDYKKVIADLVRENFFVPSEKIKNGHVTALNFVVKKINGKSANCFRIPNSFISK